MYPGFKAKLSERVIKLFILRMEDPGVFSGAGE